VELTNYIVGNGSNGFTMKYRVLNTS